jgi:hypothetical protein
MEVDQDTENVWAEVSVGSEGISVSLYSESKQGGVVVVDEWWATRGELRDLDEKIELK